MKRFFIIALFASMAFSYWHSSHDVETTIPKPKSLVFTLQDEDHELPLDSHIPFKAEKYTAPMPEAIVKEPTAKEPAVDSANLSSTAPANSVQKPAALPSSSAIELDVDISSKREQIEKYKIKYAQISDWLQKRVDQIQNYDKTVVAKACGAESRIESCNNDNPKQCRADYVVTNDDCKKKVQFLTQYQKWQSDMNAYLNNLHSIIRQKETTAGIKKTASFERNPSSYSQN